MRHAHKRRRHSIQRTKPKYCRRTCPTWRKKKTENPNCTIDSMSTHCCCWRRNDREKHWYPYVEKVCVFRANFCNWIVVSFVVKNFFETITDEPNKYYAPKEPLNWKTEKKNGRFQLEVRNRNVKPHFNCKSDAVVCRFCLQTHNEFSNVCSICDSANTQMAIYQMEKKCQKKMNRK